MKKIEAFIRPEKLDDVLIALESTNYTGMSIIETRGHGTQKGVIQQWRGEKYKVPFISKIKIELFSKEADYKAIKESIIKASKTGEFGDGKIFISDIKEAYKIRTDESGEDII